MYKLQDFRQQYEVLPAKCYFMHLPKGYDFSKNFSHLFTYQIFDFDFLESSFFGTPSSTSDFLDPMWAKDFGLGLFNLTRYNQYITILH